MAQTTLLAIEATSTIGGIALMREGALLGSVRLAHGMNLSGNLLHATEWLLERHRLPLDQVNAIVVDVGPGAFTALKIGVTMAKIWAHALEKPLIAVSAFEACAAEMAEGIPTLVALPARRDALYLQWLLPMPNAVPEPLCEPAFVVRGEIEAWLVQHTPQAAPLQAIGAERARLWIAPHLTEAPWKTIESPTPEGVAHVAWQRWQQKEFVHPFSLTPLYIQPPSIHISPSSFHSSSRR